MVGPLKKNKNKNRNGDFFASRGAHVNCAIMAMLYTHSIENQPWNTMVVFKMRDSVPSARYSPVCNVLRQWKTSLIPTYRVYRLSMILILILQWTYHDSVVSSDARLHLNPIHFLARRAVC